MTGHCQYRYNPSEQYKRTRPGMAPETICGAPAYPAVDEPEIASYPRGDGSSEFRATGRLIPRGYADPYCPAHGGSPEPAPPPVTQAELVDAYDRYVALASRYQAPGTAAIEQQSPAEAFQTALDASQHAFTETTQNEQ